MLSNERHPGICELILGYVDLNPISRWVGATSNMTLYPPSQIQILQLNHGHFMVSLFRAIGRIHALGVPFPKKMLNYLLTGGGRGLSPDNNRGMYKMPLHLKRHKHDTFRQNAFRNCKVNNGENMRKPNAPSLSGKRLNPLSRNVGS